MLKASRRWGPIAWLLCVLILSASLDRVADPPAVNPHGSDLKALCFHHTVEAAVDRAWMGGGVGSVSAPQVDPLWLTGRQTSGTGLPGVRSTEMRQAGDPSPPHRSPFPS
jgi:hypothetical protein